MKLHSHLVSLILGVYVMAVVTNGEEPGPDRDRVQEIKNSVGMQLVYIPPGKFLVGSPESEPGREAQEVQHEVELTKGFYLGAHEVTAGQFKQFVTDTKYQTDGERDGKGAYGANEAGKIEEMHARFTWRTPGFEQSDDHPVVDVSWRDAKAFCAWLSQKEKKTYRLATEAEWEYACRAGTKTAYVHGDDPEGLATVGNGADATARAKFPGWSIGIKGKDGHLFTAPVGQFKANAFGLYDMHGNVWEWCEDWYVPSSYPKEKQVDPTGPATGKAKVQRGGGWSSDAKRLRSAARVGRDHSAYRGCYLGFRVVLEKSPAEILKESGATQNILAGGRVAYMLLVNGAVTDAVVQAANIEEHKSVDAPYIGTWHDIKGMDRIQPGRLDRLERGEIDTLLIGTLHCYPHAETWNNHVGLDSTPAASPPSAPRTTRSFASFGRIQSMEGITEEQRAILQKLAWDMVSKYPYAGIAKFGTPKPSKEGEKPVRQPGDDATAMPEALKGWKATKDLPAEAVVTDYNAYIDKLPKSERPGVADVVAFLLTQRVKPGDPLNTPLPAADKPREGATTVAPPPKPVIAADSPFGLDLNANRLVITHASRPLAEFVYRDPQDKILRPFFANLHGPKGTKLTRNHPPIAGKDATDHDTMHPGIWLGFGSLGGDDFWRNRGRIKHIAFSTVPTATKDRVTFATECQLASSTGKPIANLTNRCTLLSRPSGWQLIWDATFRADAGDVSFGDQEEMGFGARVATDLTEKAGGVIVSSNGKKTARDTWGQPAGWCDYSGTRDGQRQGITLMSSPKNFRESWWHNRDYGVFVANPFGRAAMRQGAASTVTVKQGESLRLVFGAILHDAAGYDPASEYQDFLKLIEP